MYKKFFMGIAAMAALTLVSCSSDDLNSLSDNSSKNEAISFDGYLGRSAVAVNGSRGSVLEINALKGENGGFGVFGNYSSTGNTTAYGENLFKNVPVTYKTSAWTYSPLKFWPEQGHIDFLAYAPYDANTALNTTSAGKKTSTIDFTVENTVANQKDLLWAKAEKQTKDNISNKKVKFQFYHALSRLGYSVKLYGDYASNNVKFTLKSIKLAGSAPNATKSAQAFYTKGIIDLSTGKWTSKDATKQDFNNWYSGTQDVTSASASKPYKNPTTDYLFVIPQNFSANIGTTESPVANPDKLYVIVTYTITYTDGGTPEITNTVYKQLTPNFEQGKAYKINLTIGLPIEFDADVTPWGNEIGIPDDNGIDTWDR